MEDPCHKVMIYAFGFLGLCLFIFNIYYFFVRRDVGFTFYIDKYSKRNVDVILSQPEYQALVDEYDRLNESIRGKAVTVFLGDSLTKGFGVQEYFPDKTVLNRGINSDTTVSLLTRFNRNVANLKIEKLFLLIGFNDIPYRDDSAIVANIAAILDRVKANRIYVQSLLPVNGKRKETNARIVSLNRRLRQLCSDRGIEYVDLHRHFIDSKGELSSQYSLDGAHINGAGYRLWQELIRERL